MRKTWCLRVSIDVVLWNPPTMEYVAVLWTNERCPVARTKAYQASCLITGIKLLDSAGTLIIMELYAHTIQEA
jgi:hypothetical protein